MWARRWLSQEAGLVMATTGTQDPIAGIKMLARDLVDEAGLDEPPFSPALLASFQNVSEIRVTQMVSAARLIPNKTTGTLVIEVNADHSQGKRNFSANHETAHTLLPTYSGEQIEDGETGRFSTNLEEEYLCDIGASELLLGDRWLRPLALESGPSLATLLYLAELFDASLEATAYKLAELDIWSCAFVFWEEGLRKNERVGEGQMMLPLLAPYGVAKPKVRIKRPYATRSFGMYIAVNKSVDSASLVTTSYKEGCSTNGVEDFDLGGGKEKLYCENILVPYRSQGTTRRRVLSLLIREQVQSNSIIVPELFKLESQ